MGLKGDHQLCPHCTERREYLFRPMTKVPVWDKAINLANCGGVDCLKRRQNFFFLFWFEKEHKSNYGHFCGDKDIYPLWRYFNQDSAVLKRDNCVCFRGSGLWSKLWTVRSKLWSYLRYLVLVRSISRVSITIPLQTSNYRPPLQTRKINNYLKVWR